MAIFFTAKAPTAVVSYEWKPSPDVDITGVTVSATGATIDEYSFAGDVVTIVISAGTAGQTAQIATSATTSDGETLVETIYLPIIATGSSAGTVRDIVSFALRKVVGIGEEADADQSNDALERLADMLARWRSTGADVGAPSPLTLNTVIYTPDRYLSAIKYNLMVELADLYGLDVGPFARLSAIQGLVAVKMAQLPNNRAGVFF